MATALEEIRVLEFASNPAAAYATMLLAEQGARALRIEPPTGDSLRGTPHFHVLNRSKHALFIDLEAPEAAERIARLIARADIVVTGAGPHALRECALDYESIARVNPRALMLWMPPLGGRGPLADLETGEELAAALGGLAGNQWLLSGAPVISALPLANYAAGMLGAAAAAAALSAREGNGAGGLIEVSILAGALALQTGGIISHPEASGVGRGGGDPLGPIPCYRLFQAADKKYLFIACGNPAFFAKLARAIARPDLTADPRFQKAPWGIPEHHRQSLIEILAATIQTRPRREWLDILRAHDVPCAPVLTRPEFIELPQVRHLGLFQPLDDPTLGPTFQMGVPVMLSATPGQIRGPAPALSPAPVAEDWPGESRDKAATRRAAELPVSAGAGSPVGPLAGVVVLDFGSYIAGPYASMLLAQMGAAVIKIESLAGDPFRTLSLAFLGWNQGKRSIALSLEQPEGRAIARRMVERADVIIENLRPGRMRAVGLDYKDVSKLNPRIIYMSVTGFGTHGPDAEQPGFDPLLQALSGVMAAEGGHDRPPLYLTCALCDYGAAMLAALGCVLALYARQRTGRGQYCETSLLQAAVAMQAGEFVFYPGRPDLENGDPDSHGRRALCGVYRCRDGSWLLLSVCGERQWERMRALMPAAPGLSYSEAAAQPRHGALGAALEAAFSRLGRDEALSALLKADVAAVPANRFSDLFSDRQIAANELLTDVRHSQWGEVRQSGPPARFSATRTATARAAPLLGEHTDEILRERLGYDGKRIADLRRHGIVK